MIYNMLRAMGRWVDAVEVKRNGFSSADESLVEGIVRSSGHESIKAGSTILFPRIHGKVMQHSMRGEKHFYVDYEIIFAAKRYEKDSTR